MNAPAALKEGSNLIREHGLATSLVVVLLGILAYLAYLQSEQLANQIEIWQTVRERDISELRVQVQSERDFIRGELTTTIKSNAAATISHTEALRDLTDELKHRRAN